MASLDYVRIRYHLSIPAPHHTRPATTSAREHLHGNPAEPLRNFSKGIAQHFTSLLSGYFPFLGRSPIRTFTSWTTSGAEHAKTQALADSRVVDHPG